ncbi:hypothetical protein DOE76_08110 [Leifsonia sp. ku-ls]|nr:hypothetical protein DOE76_08110 [Leifsonia sp. ku-ls]
MTGDDRPHRRNAAWIGYGVPLAAGVLGLTARAVTAHDRGTSWLDVLSALLIVFAGCLLFAVALIRMFAWQDRVRTRALRSLSPAAFIVTVATDPTLVSQVNRFSLESTGRRTRLIASAYVSLVADRGEVGFYRGSRKPRLVAAFPSSVVRRVELGSSQAGARMIPCLDLVCEDGAAHGRLSVHLIRFGPVLLGFLRDDSLADAARRFGEAVGIE